MASTSANSAGRKLGRRGAPVVGAALAAAIAGAALAGPAQAATASVASAANGIAGIGHIFSAGSEIYEMVHKCMANMEHETPCVQTSQETLLDMQEDVHEIKTQLDTFTKKYAADQKRTEASLDEIVKAQSEDRYINAWNGVRSELTRGDVTLNLYSNYVDCLSAMTTTSPQNPNPTCSEVNALGNPRMADGKQRTQPATITTLARIQKDILDYQASKSGAFQMDVADVMQRIGGTSLDPREDKGSILAALLNQAETAERSAQNVRAGTPLFFYPASYVNKVGDIETRLIDKESAYVQMRAIVAEMDGRSREAQAYNDLLQDGANGNIRVLSVDEQKQTYTFPNWSPTARMAENQSYWKTEQGTVRVSNAKHYSQSANVALGLPTKEQLAEFGNKIASSGTNYSTLQKLAPQALPKSEDATGRGNPNAAARFWTAPQQVTHVNLWNPLGVQRPGWVFSYWPTDSDASKSRDQLDLFLLNQPGSTIESTGISSGPKTTTWDGQERSVQYAVYDQPEEMPNGHNGYANAAGARWSFPGAEASTVHPVWDLYYSGHTQSPLGRGSSVIVSDSKPAGLSGATPAANVRVVKVKAEGALS